MKWPFYTWQFFLWSFCDSSVTLFKVKWPPTRRFKGHLASPGTSQSYLCLLPGLASCSLCSNESEPSKPKSGSRRILGNNVTSLYQLLQRRQAGLSSLTACSRAFFFHQKLGREISPLLALCRLISNTDKQGSTVLHGKNVKTSLAQIPSAALKWHSENCPSSCWLSKRSFAVSPLLFVREDFGSRWK